MTDRSYPKIPAFVLLLLVAVVLAPNQSAATAIASADASLTLAITDIIGGDQDDLLVTVDASVFEADSFFTGNASAMFAGEATPDADGLTQRSSVTASADPTGFADAYHYTDGLLSIENLSSVSLEVEFFIEFSGVAEATIDDPANEDALSVVDMLVTSGVLGDIVEETIIAVASTGTNDPAVMGAFAFSLSLAPGEFDEIFTVVDADALAFSIFEPATLSLLGVGLAGFSYSRRSGCRAARAAQLSAWRRMISQP